MQPEQRMHPQQGHALDRKQHKQDSCGHGRQPCVRLHARVVGTFPRAGEASGPGPPALEVLTAPR